jgi:hypothetical protein
MPLFSYIVDQRSVGRLSSNYDNQYASWEAPYWQAFFQRADQIFYKLASGEMPVGVANKLNIESNDQLQGKMDAACE